LKQLLWAYLLAFYFGLVVHNAPWLISHLCRYYVSHDLSTKTRLYCKSLRGLCNVGSMRYLDFLCRFSVSLWLFSFHLLNSGIAHLESISAKSTPPVLRKRVSFLKKKLMCF
jgi:hypothetical protein